MAKEEDETKTGLKGAIRDLRLQSKIANLQNKSIQDLAKILGEMQKELDDSPAARPYLAGITTVVENLEQVDSKFWAEHAKPAIDQILTFANGDSRFHGEHAEYLTILTKYAKKLNEEIVKQSAYGKRTATAIANSAKRLSTGLVEAGEQYESNYANVIARTFAFGIRSVSKIAGGFIRRHEEKKEALASGAAGRASAVQTVGQERQYAQMSPEQTDWQGDEESIPNGPSRVPLSGPAAQDEQSCACVQLKQLVSLAEKQYDFDTKQARQGKFRKIEEAAEAEGLDAMGLGGPDGGEVDGIEGSGKIGSIIGLLGSLGTGLAAFIGTITGGSIATFMTLIGTARPMAMAFVQSITLFGAGLAAFFLELAGTAAIIKSFGGGKAITDLLTNLSDGVLSFGRIEKGGLISTAAGLTALSVGLAALTTTSIIDSIGKFITKSFGWATSMVFGPEEDTGGIIGLLNQFEDLDAARLSGVGSGLSQLGKGLVDLTTGLDRIGSIKPEQMNKVIDLTERLRSLPTSAGGGRRSTPSSPTSIPPTSAPTGGRGGARQLTDEHVAMSISDQGIAHIVDSEGFEPNVYDDGTGVLTIGHGLTEWDGKRVTNAHPGRSVTEQESYAQQRKMLARFEAEINRNLKVPVSQKQFDTLVSVAYNKGDANDLIRKANTGRELTYQDFAASATVNKVRAKDLDKPLMGLELRRMREYARWSGDDAFGAATLVGKSGEARYQNALALGPSPARDAGTLMAATNRQAAQPMSVTSVSAPNITPVVNVVGGGGGGPTVVPMPIRTEPVENTLLAITRLNFV